MTDSALLASLVVALCCITVLWMISVVVGNAAIIDVWWGLGFIVMACVYVWFNIEPAVTWRLLLTLLLVTVWGLRLSAHLFIRNHVRQSGEDYRYARMREKTGPSFWWKSYFSVYLAQALIQFLVSLPLLVAMHNGYTKDGILLNALHVIAVALYAVGILFEATADAQLTAFRKDSRNSDRVLDTGLWALTRHPNYFGDAMVWWGLWLFAMACQPKVAILTVISPIIMTYLLRKVSGVPLLEKKLRRRSGWDSYVARTPAFWPDFRKLFANPPNDRASVQSAAPANVATKRE